MGRKRKNPKHKQKTPKWYQKEDDWGNFVFDVSLGLSADAWRIILSFIIIIISFVIILGFFNSGGLFGSAFAKFDRTMFGAFGSYLFASSFLYLGIFLLIPHKHDHKKEKNPYRLSRFIGLFLLNLGVPAFLHLFIVQEQAKNLAGYGHGGGLIGYIISSPLRNGIGLFPAFLTSVALVAIALLMIFDFSFLKFFGLAKEDEEDEKSPVNNMGSRVSVFQTVKRKLSGMKKHNECAPAKAPVVEINPNAPAVIKTDSTWAYPPIAILKDADEAPNPGNIEKSIEIIRNCMSTFNIKVTMGEVNVGPTVSQYTFKPDEGVKLNQIVARQTDLALALSAKSLRMEAPIPGKSSVGLEIPNKVAAKVTLKEILQTKEFKSAKSSLTVALGRDVSGDPAVIDLEKMPHLLIAGATGSGKSVCINTVICALLFGNSPRDLRLILVDPKRVELNGYNNIPHLLSPVVTEVDKTVSSLKWAVWEMERRYKMFAELGKRNISAYNVDPGPEGKIPYIVIVIDELADLMATSAKEVEGSIVRLAQMARATGMHLVIATQRPSVDVLTGLIKANVPCRIAFATASQVDSRTILDVSGSEKLLGNGDMLFLGNGVTKPKRIQGCFVSDPEIEELCQYLRDKETAVYDESILSFKSASSMGGGMTGGGGAGDDDLYNEAVETVVRAGKGSASLLQRRLRIGYARAARLLDILEQNGVIGPAEGAKPREVLVTGSDMPFSSSGDNFQDFDNTNGSGY